ncbi:TetR/AcrR family transcriptional regulator [Amycolatopsis sp. FDAARGOS 1241]|uniref:TetR/AcrR family transcriptional regulator n=1 Tax=Amycolatopsis sp. FDAARGOS 1241 TaxID=2778070 RepID=UPI00194E2978|nr:TetR/AcrR family transcriptional regulator [Amycolatopsis sp. FDAARGOS 1241]QRP45165.1 TetR/AcrR family transcriptional regulator [Amycolatopsis sp. FDAARGOS 1241]
MGEVTAPDTRRHHGNRYGRSEDARRAVLEAADDLLVEHGFAGLTVERIAATAGVSKQTIYRWWPSKVDILLDALGDDLAEELVPPDHGDLRRDLRDHLAAVATFLTTADAGAVFRALLGQAQHDPALAARLRAEHVRGQHARDRLPFERAVARGDLPAGTDLDRAVEQLIGPIHYRVLVTGAPVTRRFTDDLVDRFLGQVYLAIR